MLEDQLNEAPLTRSKVSLNTSARQAMEDRHWLLGEELFKFVGGHGNVVIRESLFVNRPDKQGSFGFLRLTFNDDRLTSLRQFL